VRKKPPAFQFYPKQWLGDDQVMLMDWDARGMHMHLICISWQQDQPGTIPNDEALIRRWLKDPSQKVWKRVWPQIQPAWRKWGKGGDFLYSRGVLREYKKFKEFSRRQRANARQLWNYRRSHGNAVAMPPHNSGIARAGNALQSSSSSAEVIPLTPQAGDVCFYCKATATAAGGLGKDPQAPGEAGPEVLACRVCLAIKRGNRFESAEAARAYIHKRLWTTHRERWINHRRHAFGGKSPRELAAPTAVPHEPAPQDLPSADDVSEAIEQAGLRKKKPPKGDPDQAKKGVETVVKPHAQGNGIEIK
jgi:hypothetical protein